MTPAERALLLAVAKHISMRELSGTVGLNHVLDHLIAAVEAEAAPEPVQKLHKLRSCETCVEYESVHDHECGRDDSIRYPDDFCDDYRHAEADVCPLCENGRIFGKWTKCPRCGTGKKEKK